MILYALALMLVYIAVSTTYSVTVGFLIIFGLPLVLAMYAIRPATGYAARRLGVRARRAEQAPVP